MYSWADLKGTDLSYRTPFFRKEIPFCVVWSQKSACTVLFRWYLSLVGEIQLAENYVGSSGVSLHRYEREVFKHPLKDYIYNLKSHLGNNGKALVFVRCPFERAFSSYLHIHNPRYVSLIKRGIYNQGVDTRKKIVKYIYGDKEECITREFSFKEYLYWLNDNHAEIKDPHHTMQYTPLFDYMNAEFYKVENLENNLEKICRRYNVFGDSSKLNWSNHHVIKSGCDEEEANIFINQRQPIDVTKTRKVPRITKDTIVTHEVGKIIKKVFFKDIVFYDKSS